MVQQAHYVAHYRSQYLPDKGNSIPGVAALQSSLVPCHHVFLLTLQEQQGLRCLGSLSAGSAMNCCTPPAAAVPTAVVSLVSAASRNGLTPSLVWLYSHSIPLNIFLVPL